MQRLNFLLESGGPVIVLLIVMSILSLAIFLLKTWQLVKLRAFDRSFVTPAINAWRSGRADQARALLSGNPSPLARTLEAVMRMQASGANADATATEASRVAALQIDILRRLLRPLELIAYLSPLLGLLGTVIGMIRAFQALEQAGSRIDPGLLSGGIWEALLTTAAGLIVAIPAVVMLQWFERIAERSALDMRDAVGRLTRPAPAQNSLWREQYAPTRQGGDVAS